MEFKCWVRVVLCGALLLGCALHGVAAPTSGELEQLLGRELQTLSGSDVTLKAFEGKWVLLVFWASWCGPCRREIPDLKKLYETYEETGEFEIVGLSIDEDTGPLRDLVYKMDIPWPVVQLEGENLRDFSASFDVHAIPHLVLLNPEGELAIKKARGNQVERKLDEALQPAEE